MFKHRNYFYLWFAICLNAIEVCSILYATIWCSLVQCSFLLYSRVKLFPDTADLEENNDFMSSEDFRSVWSFLIMIVKRVWIILLLSKVEGRKTMFLKRFSLYKMTCERGISFAKAIESFVICILNLVYWIIL